MAFAQQVYSDFSDGFNDSVAGISIKDTEVCVSENADYSSEVKAFKTRKGCKKLNNTSFGANVTDAHTWSIGSKYKKIVVKDGKVYDFDEYAQTLTEKITLTSGATEIYPFAVFNKYYFGDGSEIYVWGDYDRSNAETDTLAQSVAVGDIIRNDSPIRATTTISSGKASVNYSTFKKKQPTAGIYTFTYSSDGWKLNNVVVSLSEYGISFTGTPTSGSTIIITMTASPVGHFYQALIAQSNVDLCLETYSTSTNKWADVTEVASFASSVVRVVKPTDPSQQEIVQISILSGANETGGTINIHIGGEDHNIAITANQTVSQIVDAIAASTSFDSNTWLVEKADDGYNVNITKKEKGLCENGYADPGKTGVSITYTTVQEGKINDNVFDPIRKCTMFLTHTSSYRIFACGNPDDNAVFYSEVGDPGYFMAENKVYALSSYGKPTGILQLSENVMISFENGWYTWQGIEALDDATWKPINLPYGCVCHDSVALTPYSYMFLGNDGIYNISASILSSELVLLQGEEVIGKITRSKVDNVMKNIYNKKTCKGIFWENAYYLAYNVNDANPYSGYMAYAVGDVCSYNEIMYSCNTTIEASETDRPFDATKWDLYDPPNTRVLKYEWDTSSFTEITGWVVNSWFTDSTSLYFSTQNYLLRTNDGYSDVNTTNGNAKAINLRIKTKEYHFGNPLVNKVVRLIGFIFKQTKEATELHAKVNVIMGYDNYEVEDVNITESLVWGRNWGLIWGFREAITKMVELSEASNTFQVEITNSSLDQPVTLVAIGFVYETTDFIIPTMYKDEDLLK